MSFLKGYIYDPERDGTGFGSLGMLEHSNNPTEKRYSCNLKNKKGIELIYTRKPE